MASVTHLERQLNELGRSIHELAAANHNQILGGIIHGPGWTTLAESALVSGMLDAMQNQVNEVARQSERLLSAAEQVGAGTQIAEAPVPLLAATIARSALREFVEAKGSKAAIARKGIETLEARNLISPQEAEHFHSLMKVVYSSEITGMELVATVRLRLQEIVDAGNGSLAAGLADAIAAPLVALEDLVYKPGGISGDIQSPDHPFPGWGNDTGQNWGGRPHSQNLSIKKALAGAFTGGVSGLISGAKAGPVGALVSALVGAVTGFIAGLSSDD
jgi:hypothetical protein